MFLQHQTCQLRLGGFIHVADDVQKFWRTPHEIVGQPAKFIFDSPVLRVCSKHIQEWFKESRNHSNGSRVIQMVQESFMWLNNHSKPIQETPVLVLKNKGMFQQQVLADRLVVLCNCIPHTVSEAQVRRRLVLDSSSLSEDKHKVQAGRLCLLCSAGGQT